VIGLEIPHMANKRRLNNRFSDWRVIVFAACIAVLSSALLLLGPYGITRSVSAQGKESPSRAQSEKDVRTLEVGKSIERELAGGQVHYFKVKVEVGQYLHLVVDQRGIDVVVALYFPEYKKLIEVDSPKGANGPEPISVIADASSSYRLEVRSLEKNAPAGRYEVRIADIRTATAQDHSRVMAERIYADGKLLELQGKAESLRKAMEKYEEALRLYRIAGDRRGEGDTLHQIGSIQASLGENRKALDYYNQALPLWQAVGDRRDEATTLNDIGLVYALLGEKQKALEYYNQALPLRRVAGDRSGEARTLTNIGAVYDSLGEKQKALDYYSQALPLIRTVGNRSVEASTLNNIGFVYNSLGEKQKALDYYNQSLSLSRAVGNRSVEAATLNNIGLVYDSLDEKQKALAYYGQALPLMCARQGALTWR
jgi:tetratricopeptide (TPR) repeat protein